MFTGSSSGATGATGAAEIGAVDRLLKALADPTRLRIVGLLQGGEVCVCHIHDSLKISQPKASRHLAYLRRAGVVRGDKRGLWVYYRLAEQASGVGQTLLEVARHCATHVGAMQRDAARLEKLCGRGAPVSEQPDLPCCAPEARGHARGAGGRTRGARSAP